MLLTTIQALSIIVFFSTIVIIIFEAMTETVTITVNSLGETYIDGREERTNVFTTTDMFVIISKLENVQSTTRLKQVLSQGGIHSVVVTRSLLRPKILRLAD